MAPKILYDVLIAKEREIKLQHSQQTGQKHHALLIATVHVGLSAMLLASLFLYVDEMNVMVMYGTGFFQSVFIDKKLKETGVYYLLPSIMAHTYAYLKSLCQKSASITKIDPTSAISELRKNHSAIRRQVRKNQIINAITLITTLLSQWYVPSKFKVVAQVVQDNFQIVGENLRKFCPTPGANCDDVSLDKIFGPYPEDMLFFNITKQQISSNWIIPLLLLLPPIGVYLLLVFAYEFILPKIISACQPNPTKKATEQLQQLCKETKIDINRQEETEIIYAFLPSPLDWVIFNELCFSHGLQINYKAPDGVMIAMPESYVFTREAAAKFESNTKSAIIINQQNMRYFQNSEFRWVLTPNRDERGLRCCFYELHDASQHKAFTRKLRTIDKSQQPEFRREDSILKIFPPFTPPFLKSVILQEPVLNTRRTLTVRSSEKKAAKKSRGTSEISIRELQNFQTRECFRHTWSTPSGITLTYDPQFEFKKTNISAWKNRVFCVRNPSNNKNRVFMTVSSNLLKQYDSSNKAYRALLQQAPIKKINGANGQGYKYCKAGDDHYSKQHERITYKLKAGKTGGQHRLGAHPFKTAFFNRNDEETTPSLLVLDTFFVQMH